MSPSSTSCSLLDLHTSVILVLTQWSTRHLKQQKCNKGGLIPAISRAITLATNPPARAIPAVPELEASTPAAIVAIPAQRTLAKVVRVSALAPEASRQEIFLMLLLFLLLHPCILLSVCCDFEAQPANVQEDADDVGR